MDFSQTQRDPRRRFTGLALVILFHVIVVYALLTGLAKKVVDVVRAPIETKVIEEVKQPPPPPEIVVPPPPRLEAPPPPFIPPPEVQVAAPPPVPTITATTPTPPPAPVVIVPTPPVAVAPPAPPAPAPARADVAVLCSRQVKPEPPGLAQTGTVTVVVSYTIAAGKVTKVDVVRYNFPGVNDRRVQRLIVSAIEAAARQYACEGNHSGVLQEFVFQIS